jgi:hypothetical protein
MSGNWQERRKYVVREVSLAKSGIENLRLYLPRLILEDSPDLFTEKEKEWVKELKDKSWELLDFFSKFPKNEVKETYQLTPDLKVTIEALTRVDLDKIRVTSQSEYNYLVDAVNTASNALFFLNMLRKHKEEAV